MSKARLIFYWVILILLMFLYYGIVDSLYSISQIDLNGGAMVGVELIAVLIAPLILVLGLVRLWLLKPVNQKSRLRDAPYFVIPLLIIIACFATWIWVGVILSVLAVVLIGYELIKSIVKIDSMLLGKNLV